jgi:serine protease
MAPAETLLRVAASTDWPSPTPPPDDQIIVQFKAQVSRDLAERVIHEAGGAWVRRARSSPRYLVGIDDGLSAESSLERLRAMPEVDFAERNGRVRATDAPNDALYSLQWHFEMVNAERTWEIQTGDPAVAVAVVDTGVAYEDFGRFRKAPDWADAVFLTGYNVLTGTNHANDDNFHGTHVASVIAEATGNGLGVTGLAHDVAIVPIKALDENGEGNFFDVAEGIDYATDLEQGGRRPVKVINLSLGADSPSVAMERAIDRAFDAGIVVVAAAGNDGVGTVGFPASLPNVIAVGGIDLRKQRAPYSNYGADLDLVAPGGDLARDDNHDDYPDGVLQQTFDPRTAALQRRYDDFAYFFVSGTSQAAPHVAAVAALLVHQGITDPTAVRTVLERTAEDLGPAGRDDEYGAGLIRPAEALKGLGLNR